MRTLVRIIEEKGGVAGGAPDRRDRRRWWMRRLPDGSRLNAVIPPLAVDGPLLSIRRTIGTDRLQPEDLDASQGARSRRR